MGKYHDRLKEGPQLDIDRAQLPPVVRSQLRTIRVSRSSDVPPEYQGTFTTVYYLAGDERPAAKRFVEENREQLEAIDFSNPDAVQASVSREIYDWILHYLGERVLRKYRSVVYERRSDGVEWVIDREHFEDASERRYARKENTGARIGSSIELDDLYDEFGDEIFARDLEEHHAVDGAGVFILKYYYAAGLFDCEPIESVGTIGIRKRDPESPN